MGKPLRIEWMIFHRLRVQHRPYTDGNTDISQHVFDALFHIWEITVEDSWLCDGISRKIEQ